VPVLNFGLDAQGRSVADPGYFQYAPQAPSGPDAGDVLGGFSLQGKPQENITANNTFELDGTWQMSDAWKMKVGAQYRESHFSSHGANPLRGATATRSLGSTSLASITTQISGLDDLFGSGAPASWAAIDLKKWHEVFDINSIPTCEGIVCGAAQSKIFEDVSTGYIMFTFDSGDRWSMPIRGDFGVRYVMTDQFASGIIPISAPPTSIYTALRSSAAGRAGQPAPD
jgi:hypothetical protein